MTPQFIFEKQYFVILLESIVIYDKQSMQKDYSRTRILFNLNLTYHVLNSYFMCLGKKTINTSFIYL